MKVTICAVGRLRAGPEKSLIDDYLTRFDRTGRALGLGPVRVAEVDERKGGGMEGEARLLDAACPKDALRLVLDERGKVMTSPDFARRLGDWRDEGRRDLAVFIGGADGLSPKLRQSADARLSFASSSINVPTTARQINGIARIRFRRVLIFIRPSQRSEAFNG